MFYNFPVYKVYFLYKLINYVLILFYISKQVYTQVCSALKTKLRNKPCDQGGIKFFASWEDILWARSFAWNSVFLSEHFSFCGRHLSSFWRNLFVTVIIMHHNSDLSRLFSFGKNFGPSGVQALPLGVCRQNVWCYFSFLLLFLRPLHFYQKEGSYGSEILHGLLTNKNIRVPLK